MKVLWFSNTCANADEYFDVQLKGTGGWLKALDKILQNYVDLHVAFYGKEPKSFRFANSNYHSISEYNSLFQKIGNKLFNKIKINDDLSKYLEIINTVKPDIIHIHGTENSFGCIIPHINIPVVVSIQGNITVYLHKFFSGFTKNCLFIINKNAFTFSNIINLFPFLRKYKEFIKMQRREENNLQFMKYVCGRTDWDSRITRVLAPGSNYFHIDEILRDSFYKYEWKPHNREITVIFTTNSNVFYKGFETLCMTLNLLNKLGININWNVAGVNDSDLIVKLTKRKLKNKYPHKNLILLGNLNESDLVNNLINSDIYVMTSHIENSPNNLCESLILGMPCISTFVGGVGSLIKDGEDGILIQSGDPWSMSGAIIELINNKNKAIEFGTNAREKALLRHDKNRIVCDLIATYSKIINYESTNYRKN